MLDKLFEIKNVQSRSISAENPQGQPGAGGKGASNLGVGRKGRPQITLPHGEPTILADIEGPGIIRHFWFTVGLHTQHQDFVLRNLVLRMYWDDESSPSVEVPLGDFFCCGFGAASEVSSIPITVAPQGGYNSYWELPFKKHARITITNDHVDDVKGFYYTINYSLGDELPVDCGYFHAQWRRSNVVKPGQDHVILDGVKGRGLYVGTYLALAALGRYWWGEGEMKFFLDGDTTWPTICGTGIEDYFGGAWCYWKMDDNDVTDFSIGTYSTPFLGYHYHSNVANRKIANYAQEGIPCHGLYRWHLKDPIRFNEALKVTVQDIGHDDHELFERSDDISSVAYWYQVESHQVFPKLPLSLERRPR